MENETFKYDIGDTFQEGSIGFEITNREKTIITEGPYAYDDHYEVKETGGLILWIKQSDLDTMKKLN